MTGETPAATIAQAVVAVALILAATVLGYLDPGSRSLLVGAIVSGIGVVIGFFFSQRSSSSGVHAATNGMSTMAGLIAAGTPGPPGPQGPQGPRAAAAEAPVTAA